MSVTVLLADDHPIVRQGLKHLIEAEADLKMVGEASMAWKQSSLRKSSSRMS